MRELTTSIEIDAAPQRVWDVLTDFASYGEWNPFIRSIVGKPDVGSRVRVRIEPPDGRGLTLKPTVRSADPARELSWLGRLLVPGVFDGEHRFRLEPLDGDRTRFTQSERFRGVLVPLTGKVLEKTQRGFEEMNDALKRRVESGT
jgi:hypothetical protein